MASLFSASSFLVVGRAPISLLVASSASFSTIAMACSHSLAQTYFHPVSICGKSCPLISLV